MAIRQKRALAKSDKPARVFSTKNSDSIILNQEEKEKIQGLLSEIQQAKIFFYEIDKKKTEIRNLIDSKEEEFRGICQNRVAEEGHPGATVNLNIETGILTIVDKVEE